MIGKILSGIIGFVITLISYILGPIDALIADNIPVLNDFITSINGVINYCISCIGYVIDASGLTTEALLLIVAYYTFTITATFSASFVKLAIKWYKALVP